MKGYARLQREVIESGLCTDCGTCAGVCPSQCLVMNYEREQPEAIKECPPRCNLCYEVCPGKDIPMHELEQMTFGRERKQGTDEEYLGVCQQFFRGYAVDKEVRRRGACGGVGTALLLYALENNIIDSAIVAAMSQEQPWRVVPKIATSRQDIIDATQSKYSLVPLNSILGEAQKRGLKRIGVVTSSCHCHGIRKMQSIGKPTTIADRIALVIGLTTGTQYSYHATEHAIEELLHVPIDHVAKLEYTGSTFPAKFTVVTKDGQTVACPHFRFAMSALAFTPERCRMCFDYSNELSDLSLGDLSYPPPRMDEPGWTAIAVRSDLGRKLMTDAQNANYIHLEPIENYTFFMWGWEPKKHGSSYVISQRKRLGLPVPDYHLPLLTRPLPKQFV